MDTQQLRAEIAKAIFQDDIKISSLSDEHYNTYSVGIKFKDSNLQQMFHVKPLNEDGEEIKEDFYFISEKRAIEFMNENRGFHTLAWWQAMCKQRHHKWAIQCHLYFARKMRKGGIQ